MLFLYCVFPQTDSGSDNESKYTHAFHWFLVHTGVVNKVIWIRLSPHHSHNMADRANSMVKEVPTTTVTTTTTATTTAHHNHNYHYR